MGPTPQIRIAWTPKAEGATGLDALTSVQVLQRSTIDEGILRTSVRFDYSISRAAIPTLALRVPGDQKVVSVFDPNIRKWSVRQEDGKQIVDIELFEAARQQQGVQLELEQLLETPKDADRITVAIPELAAVDAGRQQGILVVKTTEELSMETVKTSGLLRMDAAELPDMLRQPGQNWEAAYRISSTSYSLDLSINKVEPRITAASQIRLNLDAYHLRTEMFTVFNVERTGVFQFTFEIPADAESVSARGHSRSGLTAVDVDGFTLADSKDHPGMKTMTVNLRRKAFGPVGVLISYLHTRNEADLKSPTGKTVEIPIKLPGLGKGVAQRSDGRLIVEATDAFRLNTLDAEGLQPVSVQQALGNDWNLGRSSAQLGFLFAETLPAFKLQAERRKPQLVLQEVRTVRIEDGSIKHTAKFHYEVRFSGIKSLRIDVPEALSGRLNLRGDDNWRETRMIPPPEDVAQGFVAWEFATRSDILGKGHFEVAWEDELSQLDIGKSLQIDIPRLVPQKQQPSDRIWGQIVLSKSQSIDLGESEATKGLKPIDPQHDLQPQDRIGDAVAAFEFHDDWTLQVVATRYKLEEVKRTSIERGFIRANLFFTKTGTGISAQALFRIRSVQQRLELAMPEKATISDIRVNGQNIVLESDTASGGRPRFMIPLTTVPPDTPFILDIRYTVDPPCDNRIEIPSFPGIPETKNTAAVPGPAIQKVFLAAYVPEDRILVGFRGDWSKDFTFQYSDSRTLPVNTPSVDSLFGEFASGGRSNDFSVSGNPWLFSAIHPGEDAALTLTIVPDRIGAAVFVVLVLIGLAMLALSWLRRFQAVIALSVIGIVLGYVYSTFGSLLLNQSAACYAVLVVAAIWLLQAVYELARKRKTTDNLADTPAPTVSEPVSTCQTTEGGTPNHA